MVDAPEDSLIAWFLMFGLAAAADIDEQEDHLPLRQEILQAFEKGDLDTALADAKRLLDHLDAEHADDVELRENALAHVEMVLVGTGRLREILDVQLELVQVRTSIFEDDPESWRDDLGLSYNNVGSTLGKLEEYDAARLALKRSLELRNGDGRYATLHNLAALDMALGDFEAAIPIWIELVEHWRSTPDGATWLAETLRYLGVAYWQVGRYPESRQSLEEAIALGTDLSRRRSTFVAQSLTPLADLLTTLGDYEAGRALHREVVEIIEEVEGPDDHRLASSLNNLAGIENYLGHVETALALYERAARLNEAHLGSGSADLAVSLSNIARTYAKHGDLDRAEGNARKARSILEEISPDHRYLSAPLSVLSLIAERRGDVEGALTLIRDAGSRTRRLGNQTEYAGQRFAEAYLLYALGHKDDARAVVSETLGIYQGMAAELIYEMSDRERLGFTWRFDAGMQAAIQVNGDPEFVADGYDAVLQWKGLAADALGASRAAARQSSDPEVERLSAGLVAIGESVAAATLDPSLDSDTRKVEVQRLLVEKDTIERNLAARTAELAPVLGTVNHRALCEQLVEGAALVDFVRHSSVDLKTFEREYRYIAFLLRQRDCSVQRIELGSEAEVDDAVTAYYERVRDPNPSRLDRAGHRLREVVWDPVAAELGAPTLVYLVPDGAIARVSYGGLPEKKTGYLLETQRFTYLDRASVLLREAPARQGSGSLVMGGLDYGSARKALTPCLPPPFEPLPATIEEVESVSRLLSKRTREPSRVLTAIEGGATALIAALADGPRVVHLATHGFSLPADCGGGVEGQYARNAMSYSGLALANANDGPAGVWTAEEVAALDLSQTELVVLSACDTGLGHIIGSDGVLGLRRAFSAAGVGTQVVSLWSVEDEATRDLMTALYRAMTGRRGVEPVDALRAAQLNILESNRRKYGHGLPTTWGAFIAGGDAQSNEMQTLPK